MADFRTATISIQGCRTDRVPATVGLRSIWTSIEYLMPDTSFYNSTFPLEVGVGVDVGQVFAALRALVARHDSLRSHFFRDEEGMLIQQVRGEGEIIVELCEAGSEDDQDFCALLREQEERIKAHRFDHETELPIRVGIGLLDGAPRGVVLCASHAATDLGGLLVLVKELETLLQGGRLEEPALQPAQLAEWEGSVEGRRVQERALRHWRRQLQAMPSTLLEVKYSAPEVPHYPRVWLRSTAAAMAATTLAARCRVTDSSVLLAGAALLLGQAAREPRVTMQLISANRTRRMLRDYVGNVVQGVLVGIDLTGVDFAAVARSAFSASVQAYRNTHCERAVTDRMWAAESAERGTEVEVKHFFNDVRPYVSVASPARVACSADVRAAMAESRIEVRDGAEHDDLLTFLRISAVEDESIELTLRADSLRMRSEEMTRFLLRLEALLAAAVELGIDSPAQRLLEQSGPPALTHGR